MADPHTVVAGRYRLDAVLGRGGMGQVWRGRDETLGRAVAVKEVRLPADLDADQRAALVERMLREARLTARLSHPGVVTVYDVVQDQGRPFIVMELLEVPTLAEAIARDGPLPPARVAAIGLRLLEALDAAHRDGIVHRDVKPGNVLLAADRVVLTDFGIALSESDPRMTSTGLLVGSPTYMSPERLRGRPTGPETDLWSLGATLYAAAEGRPPFQHETTMGTVSAVLTDPMPPPATTGSLRAVLAGLLDKDPAGRLTARQVRPLLHRVAGAAPSGHDGAAAAPTTTFPPGPGEGTEVVRAQPAPEPAPRPVRGSRLAVRAALVGLGLLAALGMVLGALAVLDDGTPTASGTDTSTPSTSDPGPSGTTGPATTGPATTGPATTGPATTDSETSGRSGGGGSGTGGPGDVPAGYRLQRDPLGFEVAVPRGWGRSLDGESRVDFVSPDGSTFLRVDQVAEAGPSAEQAWLDAEPAVADRLAGYERIRIEPVDYRSWDTADWEFTWQGDSGRVHVLDRGIATDTRGFALYVSAPDAQWDSAGVPLFETAADTFRPVE